MGGQADLCWAEICPAFENQRRSGKFLPGLDLPDPCPGTWILGLQGRPSMHSRPPRSLPGANPPPDLREGPQWHTRRPTSAKLQSGKIPARPPRKSGGRENSCRANPGPTWASCSLGFVSKWAPPLKAGFPFLETGFPFLKTGFPFLKHMPRLVRYLPECFWP